MSLQDLLHEIDTDFVTREGENMAHCAEDERRATLRFLARLAHDSNWSRYQNATLAILDDLRNGEHTR